MTDLYHPSRGGTRGGQAEFKWDNVKGDKDRENYLGHSINAPTGRWQNRKDIHWYARDVNTDEDEKERKRKAEIKRQKELEENALSIALGYGPTLKEDGEGTGANGIKVEKTEKELELERLEAEDKKKRKELRAQKKDIKRLEKEVKKELKQEEKAKRRADRDYRSRSRDSRPRDYDRRPTSRDRYRDVGGDRRRSRSRSPVAKYSDRRREVDDKTPPRDIARSSHRPARRSERPKVEDYDFEEERARERKR